jgi:hypothetical protein
LIQSIKELYPIGTKEEKATCPKNSNSIAKGGKRPKLRLKERNLGVSLVSENYYPALDESLLHFSPQYPQWLNEWYWK